MSAPPKPGSPHYRNQRSARQSRGWTAEAPAQSFRRRNECLPGGNTVTAFSVSSSRRHGLEPSDASTGRPRERKKIPRSASLAPAGQSFHRSPARELAAHEFDVVARVLQVHSRCQKLLARRGKLLPTRTGSPAPRIFLLPSRRCRHARHQTPRPPRDRELSRREPHR